MVRDKPCRVPTVISCPAMAGGTFQILSLVQIWRFFFTPTTSMNFFRYATRCRSSNRRCVTSLDGRGSMRRASGSTCTANLPKQASIPSSTSTRVDRRAMAPSARKSRFIAKRSKAPYKKHRRTIRTRPSLPISTISIPARCWRSWRTGRATLKGWPTYGHPPQAWSDSISWRARTRAALASTARAIRLSRRSSD